MTTRSTAATIHVRFVTQGWHQWPGAPEHRRYLANEHRHLFSVIMDKEWGHGVPAAVDITLLGRFYERFGDHAVSVAKRTVFVVTGRMPGYVSGPEDL